MNLGLRFGSHLSWGRPADSFTVFLATLDVILALSLSLGRTHFRRLAIARAVSIGAFEF